MPETAADSNWLVATALLMLSVQQRLDFETVDKPERNEDEKYGWKQIR